MVIANAKKPYSMRLYAYGDFNGVLVDVEIIPEQKWKVRTAGGYIYLSRKGGATLRLTPTAFNRLFILSEE